MKNVLKKGFIAVIFAIMFVAVAPSVLPNNNGMDHVEAASVKLNATKVTLIKGQTKTLKVKGTSKKVKWSSNKKSVATVNSKGKVTAKKKGTAKITAKVGGKKYTCKVTVETPKISKESVTLTVGDTKTLKISGTSQKITWSSNKTSVATVSSKGKVTAKKAGTATITAKVGGKKYKCKVTVNKKTVAVTGIKLNKTSATLTEGDTLSLSATVSPSDATDKTVTWSSSSSSVASVNSSGKVTAKKAGTATITAKAGTKQCTCKITVNEKTVAVTSITLSKTSATLTEGDTLSLTATVSPSDATDKTVTWSSSNSSVASVNSSGNVTAIKAGTATITAKAGSVKCECTITVEADPYSTLKEFLIANGTNSGNDYNYVYEYSSSTTLTITYSNSSDMFTFVYEDKTGTCTLSYNKNLTEITPTVHYDQYGTTFDTSVTFTKSTYYNGQTLTFTIIDNPSGVTSSLVQGTSNNYLLENCLVTEVFLNDKVGITLQDLGFLSFQ